MSEPFLLPYVEIPMFTLIPAGTIGLSRPIGVQPFGAMVAIGVYTAVSLTMSQAKAVKLDQEKMYSFIGWIVVSGFCFAHWFDLVLYHPERLLKDPMSLLWIWESMSSFGGFVGGFIGAMAWGFWFKQPVLPYADIAASSVPVGWFFGRIGCALAHDHPGLATTIPLAMAFPDHHGGSVARLDLGFLEMLLWIPIMIACFQLRREARPWGLYLGFLMTVYAPSRFALDFLRATDLAYVDKRYFDLTPAQWWAFPMMAGGVALLFRALSRAGNKDAYAAPRAPSAVEQTPSTSAG